MAGYRIITVPTGRYEGRSYILICNDTGDAAVIDTDTNANELLRLIDEEGATLRYILLTHYHFDHVSSSDFLSEKTGAKTAIHRLELPGLLDPALNMSGPFHQGAITGRQIDRELQEGDVVTIGNIEVKVLHTPGHTPGSCCFLVDSDMFTGDTIFRGSYGNTGFPGGDMGALMSSAARLLSMDESIALYPGHGRPSTIARERVMNPISI